MTQEQQPAALYVCENAPFCKYECSYKQPKSYANPKGGCFSSVSYFCLVGKLALIEPPSPWPVGTRLRCKFSSLSYTVAPRQAFVDRWKTKPDAVGMFVVFENGYAVQGLPSSYEPIPPTEQGPDIATHKPQVANDCKAVAKSCKQNPPTAPVCESGPRLAATPFRRQHGYTFGQCSRCRNRVNWNVESIANETRRRMR